MVHVADSATARPTRFAQLEVAAVAVSGHFGPKCPPPLSAATSNAHLSLCHQTHPTHLPLARSLALLFAQCTLMDFFPNTVLWIPGLLHHFSSGQCRVVFVAEVVDLDVDG